jgi:hypothetical protein
MCGVSICSVIPTSKCSRPLGNTDQNKDLLVTHTLSPHAQQRSHERRITAEAIELALEYGEMHHAKGGMKAYFMSRRAIARAHRKWNIDLTKYMDVAVIASPDHHVVTVQYCRRPKNSWTGHR